MTRWSYGSDPIYKNEPNAAKFFSARLSLWFSLSNLLSKSTTLLIFLQKEEGALSQKKRHMVTLCARVSSCQSFRVHQVGLATWAMIHFFLGRRQKKLKAKSRHLSKIQVHRHVRFGEKTCLLLVLVSRTCSQQQQWTKHCSSLRN